MFSIYTVCKRSSRHAQQPIDNSPVFTSISMDDLRKQMDDLVGENEKLKHINVSLEEEANLLRKDMELKDGELRRLKDRIKDLLDDIERLRDVSLCFFYLIYIKNMFIVL